MKKLILALAVAATFGFGVSSPASATEYEETGESSTTCHNVSFSDCLNFATEEQEDSIAAPIFGMSDTKAEKWLRRHGWEFHDDENEANVYWSKPGHKLRVFYHTDDWHICKFIDKHGGTEDSESTDDCSDLY